MGTSEERHILYYLNLAKNNGSNLWQDTELEYEQIIHAWNILTQDSEDADDKRSELILKFI